MSKHNEIITKAFTEVTEHVDQYVIPQYGDYGSDPAAEYTVEDCIKQSQRYISRFGKSSRQGEERRDLHKAIHWMTIALHKMETQE